MGFQKQSKIIFHISIILLFVLNLFTNQTSLFADDDVILVPENTSKRVLVPKSSVSTNWKENNDFDDSTWQLCSGNPGGIGYEKNSGYEGFISLDVGNDMHNDGGDPNSSCLIRIKFDVNSTDLENAKFMMLTMSYDDGFAAYLNGTKIASANTPNTLEWNSSSQGQHEHNGGSIFNVSTYMDKIVDGENLLAIHGLNTGTSSSDFLINAELSVGSQLYGDFTSSNLPIIMINTNGQQIVDDPRITADMGIIYNGSGKRNNITDPFNHYDGKIGIELRGASSQGFPKKPYRIETIDEDGENNNVSLFGMPEENDWVLQNPYYDKSLIRNILAYRISTNMGHYASRTQPVEVFLNDDYQGVYVFMEKIKRDKNRVDIAKLKEEDIAGEDLTGGYIIKVDKFDGQGNLSWSGKNVSYLYHYPKPADIQPEQKEYIKNYITNFEEIMQTDHFDDSAIGYPKYIDFESLIDFFIINEVTRNVDGYRISTYMYKDRDDNGGKLKFGPAWDFNLSLGVSNWDGNKTSGWNLDYLIEHTAHEYTPPFWWAVITESDDFKTELYNRWTQLRKSALNKDVIEDFMDHMAATLNEAQVRNFERWGQNANYNNEIQYIKDWLADRIQWMDDTIDGYQAVSVEYSEQENNPSRFCLQQNYPNPFNPSTQIQYSISSPVHVTLSVYNVLGQHVKTLVDQPINTALNQIEWDGTNENGLIVPNGVYFYRMNSTFGMNSKKMLFIR